MRKILSLLALMMLAITSSWAVDVSTLTLNGSEVSSPENFFSHDTSGKFNFNTKFNDAEYDGISFTSGLKMEGNTKILFTTSAVGTVTIVQSTWSANTIKFDDEELAVDGAAAGTVGKGPNRVCTSPVDNVVNRVDDVLSTGYRI